MVLHIPMISITEQRVEERRGSKKGAARQKVKVSFSHLETQHNTEIRTHKRKKRERRAFHSSIKKRMEVSEEDCESRIAKGTRQLQQHLQTRRNVSEK
jgi:hypothetical protein